MKTQHALDAKEYLMAGCHSPNHTPFQQMQKPEPTLQSIDYRLDHQEGRITYLQDMVQCLSDRLSNITDSPQMAANGSVAPIAGYVQTTLIEENIRLSQVIADQEREIASLRHRIGLLGETLHHVSGKKE